MSEQLKSYIMLGALALMVVVIAWSFWKAQADPRSHFNLFDLLMEDRKLSPARVTYMGAFAATTWVLMDNGLRGEVDPVVYGAYLGAWAGSLTAVAVFGNRVKDVALKREMRERDDDEDSDEYDVGYRVDRMRRGPPIRGNPKGRPRRRT